MSADITIVDPEPIIWDEGFDSTFVCLRLGSAPARLTILFHETALEKFLEATHIFALSRQPAE